MQRVMGSPLALAALFAGLFGQVAAHARVLERSDLKVVPGSSELADGSEDGEIVVLEPETPALTNHELVMRDPVGRSGLDDYCGLRHGDGFEVGQRVQADFRGLGQYYEAYITRRHDTKLASYDVRYGAGALEGLGEEHLEAEGKNSRLKRSSAYIASKSASKSASTDAVCQLAASIEKIEDAAQTGNALINNWLVARVIHAGKDKSPEPSVASSFAAALGNEDPFSWKGFAPPAANASAKQIVAFASGKAKGYDSDLAAGLRATADTLDLDIKALNAKAAAIALSRDVELNTYIQDLAASAMAASIAASTAATSLKAMPAGSDAQAPSSDLVDELKNTRGQFLAVQKFADRIVEGVVGDGSKWWRFLYEYSFVQTALLIVVLVLHFFWHFANWLLVKAAEHEVEAIKIPQYSSMVRALAFRCLDRVSNAMMVQFLVLLTGWVAFYAGFHHQAHQALNAASFRSLHLPRSPEEFGFVFCESVAHFAIALLLYYGIAFQIARRGLELVRIEKHTEEESGEFGGLRRKIGTVKVDQKKLKARLEADPFDRKLVGSVRRHFEAQCRAFGEAFETKLRSELAVVLPIVSTNSPDKTPHSSSGGSRDNPNFFWLYEYYLLRINLRKMLDLGFIPLAVVAAVIGMAAVAQFHWRLLFIHTNVFFLLCLGVACAGVAYVHKNAKTEIEKIQSLNLDLLQTLHEKGPLLWSSLQAVLLVGCISLTQLVLSPWAWRFYHFSWPLGVLVCIAVYAGLVTEFSRILAELCFFSAIPHNKDDKNAHLQSAV